jgi:PAS domain S-box-containing protein
MDDDIAISEVANSELEKVQQFSDAILNSLKEHVAVINRHADIIAVNTAWQRFAEENGVDAKTQLGIGSNYAKVCQHVVGDSEIDAQTAIVGIKAVLSGKQDSFTFEYSRSSATGPRYFIMSVLPLQGKRGGAIVSHRKISARKKSELELQASERRFRTMADSAPVLIWVSGLDKGCTFFNKQWLEFTGRTQQQETGDDWAQGVHPYDIERRLHIYTSAFDKREDFKMEYRLRRYDGEYRWLLDAGTANYLADGTFTGYIGSCVDITDRKQLEQRLQEEKNYTNTIIENTPGLFFMLDRQGRYVRWNKNTEIAAGCNAEEMSNKLAVDFISDKDKPRVQQAIETGFRDGHVNIQYDNLTTAGQVTYAGYAARAHIDGQDYLIGFELDISERIRAAQETHQLREELNHVNRVATMGELSAALAHELNQPLTAILNNANAAQRILKHEQPDMDEIRDILVDIANDDRRAGAIIQRLRALLLKGEPVRTLQDINEIVLEVIELVRGEAIENNIKLSTQLEKTLPKVVVDRVQLQQVMLNLIVNGFDAMKAIEGKKELQIKTTCNGAETIKLSVIDSGAGLDQDKMQLMFDAFFTTKPQGMGMGLSICRTIIDGHGGYLWANRNSEQGMSLHLELPIAEGLE